MTALLKFMCASALGSGFVYGLYRQGTLQTAEDKRKAKAAEEAAAKAAASGGPITSAVFDPENPNFDLEAYLKSVDSAPAAAHH
mmetsp:Transcript_4305/g.6626  ORF Transcript_4305/g.6626 Transcript_4305/m.6626 type:complete len:84 (+) Transcript_4305:31-282(+)|eukprot:CAMPEP_0184664582 /NCGR_PEP_ID=MMETSP0308-20130426/53541_1 /TAXON_ID=38269 /ORGANISM="Gloeochaete witrockiana, Strain SAG 46.84" /LENGTH=83 /DNA_ID=CAMNT_0027108079 /DNA_START=26 /DNA_END=277 /DNA_ORIENTATION=+